MTDDDEVGCDESAHVFAVEEDAETPDDQACLCGQVTWGEMNELLTLHRMFTGEDIESEMQ